MDEGVKDNGSLDDFHHLIFRGRLRLQVRLQEVQTFVNFARDLGEQIRSHRVIQVFGSFDRQS